MVKVFFAVIAGFLAWLILWLGCEKVLSAIWPVGFGAHQLAFEMALTNGTAFTPNATHLLAHIVLGAIVSVLAGFLAALISKGSRRAPLALGFLLMALGILKAVMSWSYVPIWYHVVFTALLMPMTILGGKLKGTPNE